MDKNSSNERCNITALSNTLQNIMKYADETARQFFGEDIVDVAACSTEILSDSFKLLQALKKVASIPTKLYMRKFDRYCRGLTQIPLNKRQRYIKKLGSEAINKENIFILNVINRIEDEEKLDFLVKLCAARLDTKIDDDYEYRRLVIMVDRTMFSDLIYLEENITTEPIALSHPSEDGLVASGLLTVKGNELLTEITDDDTGIRFAYSPDAHKLAEILFHWRAKDHPPKIILHGQVLASDQEVNEMLDDVFDHNI